MPRSAVFCSASRPTRRWRNRLPAQSTAADPGFTTGLLTRGNLLGDPGGAKAKLWNYGITIGLQDINEVWANVSGGQARGSDYDGLTLMSVGLDTQRAFGWEGGTFNISALQIRGRSISNDYLLNLQTASGILATPTTRLWEAWYQQSFRDGAFDVKVGQQSIDQEFITSTYTGLFLNTMMGWPMTPSADLYAGGPAYPLSSLGIRLRGQLGHGFTGLAGVFQDNPPGGPFDDDGQLRGSTRWGGNFNLRTGALFVAEIQYALNQPSKRDDILTMATARSACRAHLQDRRLVRHRQLPRPAVRQHRPVARRSEQHRGREDAATQLELLRRRRPDDLATLRGQSAIVGRIRPPDGHPVGSQPDQLQRQRRAQPEGAAAGSR